MTWAVRFQMRQHLRQSLLAVPFLGAVAGGALAVIDLSVEDQVTLPREWSYSASTASRLLTTVSGAMIGLLGLVVTVGVLVARAICCWQFSSLGRPQPDGRAVSPSISGGIDVAVSLDLCG